MKKVLHYLPRVLSAAMVGFFALFVLEGFDPDFSWFDGLMHFILALVVFGVTIFSWKKPNYGGWIFVAFGVWYEISVLRSGWYGGLFLGSIPIIVGILFILENKSNAPRV